MITPKRSRILTIAIGFFLFAGNIAAQKKGAAATPATPAPAAGGTGATASNAPFEVQMLSYGALDQVLDKLAKYACAEKPSGAAAGAFTKVVILDQPSLQALQAFDSFYANAEALISAFNSMTSAGGAGAGPDDFADVTNAVAAAATASTSETTFSFTIPDPTAALMLLRHLGAQPAAQCQTAHYAGVYTVNEIKGPKIHGKPLPSVSDELSAIANTRAEALSSIVSPDAGDEPPCAAIPGVATAPAKGAITSQDACVAAFNTLDGTYNAFLAGLSAANATTGQPGLSMILQGYRLRALFASATPASPMLGIYLNVSSAGGTQQDRKNLLTNLFTGDWIRYSGGVAVNLVVFQIAEDSKPENDQSKILFSDLIRYRTPLGSIKKPKGYDHAAEAGDNLDNISSAKKN